MKHYQYTPDMDILKIKFYQRKHFSKDFDNITEEDVKRIEERVNDFRTRVLDGKELNEVTFHERNALYASALRYLVSPTIGQEFPTYDERMLFLIKLMDPDVTIAQAYMQAPFKTSYEIAKADEEEKEYCLEHNRKLRAIINNEIVKMVGFTDPDFVFFERKYYAKFIRPNQLEKNITSNFVNELFDICKCVRHFRTVTPENYETSVELAKNYLAQFDETPSANTIAFNLLKQNKAVGGDNTIKQIALLFILLVDPELNMLKIYYDESMYPKMEERSMEELGFYNPELLRLEVEYHRAFTPEKKISEWQI
jgi:hypothetical protein